MKDLKVKVLSNAPIASGIYRMEFALPEETEGMRCGKFLNISVGDGAHLLRRPIAICEYEKDRAAICYQIKGEGTFSLYLFDKNININQFPDSYKRGLRKELKNDNNK